MNELFEGKLRETIPKRLNLAVEKAMEYALTAGGKRLRPNIIFSVSSDLRLSQEIVMDIAVAVELLHTASLIHDDLPAIDDANMRRGKPACHRVFGENIAVLAGDGLFFLSFSILSRTMNPILMREFSETAFDLLLGESADVEYENCENVTEENVLKMYELKTGALFGFSFSAPAIVANEMSLKETLKKLGRAFGVAFQIFDDLKDVEGDPNLVGKDVGKDINKKTLIKLVGVEKSRKMADEIYEETSLELLRLGFRKTYEFLKDVKEAIMRK
ncbi:MAG: geranyl transferase [Thermotoga sp. 4484_232]|nr:polyprenyl synthetase family protein [Thermotogaceae bacterium]OQX57989.1 MAG: geranyl transferase [Thermotoga sp. 4484_232]RKX41399.1 MAG: polyprenyl synthetase family protein [Thermotogota bacterium]RKX52700.1 MAG: polyprenyl synthetase family protein [Thermotoga sp.]HDG61426.1 polyprenyl synthetase family protein [Thermotoga sp.]